MKCLFLSASRYSVHHTVIKGFEANNCEIKTLDYYSFFSKRVNTFLRKTSGIPDKIKNSWLKPYIHHINKQYILQYNNFQPDIVLIYNHQFVSAEVIREFKKQSKVVFILGDNPFYSQTSLYNVEILFYADYIVCPDSFWTEQLGQIGLKTLHTDYFGYNPDNYFSLQASQDEKRLYGSDLIYVGIAYNDNRGYKRFLFLNHFNKFDLKAYMTGNGYSKIWHNSFPELEKHIIKHDVYSTSFNNLLYNCSKIAPIELTPSIFHGIHMRLFDALGAGILPLCEYSKDLYSVFANIDFPVIRQYNEIESLTEFFLKNEDKRKEIVTTMKNCLEEKYLPEQIASRVLKGITDNLSK